MTDVPQQMQFTVDWVGLDEVPPLASNQMICQLGLPAGDPAAPDGVYLTFGFAAPPVLLGDEQAIQATLEAMGGRVPVRTLARFILTKERAQELVGVLMTTIGQYEEAVNRGQGVQP